MDEHFIINGGKKLEGKISVSNAKNAALKILAASVLASKPVKISGLPEIEDINRMKELLIDLGVKHYSDTFDSSRLKKTDLNYQIADRFRASIVLTGPLLARFGRVSFPHPGGCTLGKRPIDFFIDGFKSFGAAVKNNGSHFMVTSKNKKLIGNKFIFPMISVTGTETLMMAATLAKGKTILKNTACEPEIENLAVFLNSLGAKISGAGTPVIEIEGVRSLGGGEWNGMPDRIEAGTFIILGVASNSNIKVENCETDHLDVLLTMLEKAGANLEIGKNYVMVKPAKRLQSVDITTREYPGFATDLQAPFTVLMTQTKGISLIHETIYNGRLFYTDILNQMGADITMADPHRVIVKGPTVLHGKRINSPDIRAGMALLIAALLAKGQSVIDNIYQIDRGYDKVDERLKALGADIERAPYNV
ncbi:MAG: UDP-N-acetylglucosamine 1-carboxyvinyltransferase [Candidatus Azambacteria bacterium]|nr:UDP-N-acetylglucosamine 1-carboxyvinyltransferase [Candidatus Azambacteria bacterium]